MARNYKRDRKGRFARMAGGARAGMRAKKGRKKAGIKNPSLRKAVKSASSPGAKNKRQAARNKRSGVRNNEFARRNGVNSSQPQRKLTGRERKDIAYGAKGSKWKDRTTQQNTNRIARGVATAYAGAILAKNAQMLAPVAMQALSYKSAQRANRNFNSGIPTNALRSVSGEHLGYARTGRLRNRGVYNITTL